LDFAALFLVEITLVVDSDSRTGDSLLAFAVVRLGGCLSFVLGSALQGFGFAGVLGLVAPFCSEGLVDSLSTVEDSTVGGAGADSLAGSDTFFFGLPRFVVVVSGSGAGTATGVTTSDRGCPLTATGCLVLCFLVVGFLVITTTGSGCFSTFSSVTASSSSLFTLFSCSSAFFSGTSGFRFRVFRVFFAGSTSLEGDVLRFLSLSAVSRICASCESGISTDLATVLFFPGRCSLTGGVPGISLSLDLLRLRSFWDIGDGDRIFGE
jgi:hypothetical protein